MQAPGHQPPGAWVDDDAPMAQVNDAAQEAITDDDGLGDDDDDDDDDTDHGDVGDDLAESFRGFDRLAAAEGGDRRLAARTLLGLTAVRDASKTKRGGSVFNLKSVVKKRNHISLET